MHDEEYVRIKNQLNFEKSHRYLVQHILTDTLIVAALIIFKDGLSSFQPYIVGSVLAVLMFRSFSMMHEAVHGIASRSRRVNDAIGHFYGVLCFLPFSQWKAIHLDHHIWAGNLDRDPTMRILKEFRDSKVPPSALQEASWSHWLPYLAFRQQIVFWSRALTKALEQGFVRAIRTWSELLGLFVYSASLVQCFGWLSVLIAFAVYMMMIELINFPHHLGLPQGGGAERLAPREQFKVARSVIYSRLLARGVFLNFNYHVEHHLFPTLPWYQLDVAHALIRQALGERLNLCHGNGWLVESRRFSFKETLEKSTASPPDSQKAKLVS